MYAEQIAESNCVHPGIFECIRKNIQDPEINKWPWERRVPKAEGANRTMKVPFGQKVFLRLADWPNEERQESPQRLVGRC